jgi:hypothetical protein
LRCVNDIFQKIFIKIPSKLLGGNLSPIELPLSNNSITAE